MADQIGRELRIGDADRTAAADELAEHYAQGRLSTEEHHERLDRIWAARTRSELAPVFADLPGSAYHVQRPTGYQSADRPGIGAEERRPQPPFAVPFGRTPPGRRSSDRTPYGRPPYATTARSRSSWFGVLSVLVKLVLVVVAVALVLANLPLVLIGLLVWALLAHKNRQRHGYQRRC